MLASRPGAAAEEQPNLFQGVQPVTQRELSRGIHRAEERIAKGEFADALRYLDGLLARDDDAFVEIDGSTRLAGLKARAADLLRNLPPAGREAYLAAFSSQAERELREALSHGDGAALERIASRYFPCAAGQEAELLLARRDEDGGRPAAALRRYERLLATAEVRRSYDPQLSIAAAAAARAAGDDARSTAILADLKTLVGDERASVRIAGRPEPLPQAAQGTEWMRAKLGAVSPAGMAQARDWLAHRGNAARTAESSGGMPHMRVRWQVRALPHPDLEEIHDELADALRESGRLVPPAMEPLAVGELVVMRTPHAIFGVDFVSGKLVWQAEPVRAAEIEQLLPRESGDEETGDNGAGTREQFSRRVWRDRLSGVMSSDGQRVFAVRTAPPTSEGFNEFAPFEYQSPVMTNRLCAYDLRTGDKAWEIDGADAAGTLPGAYFTGAPLCVDGAAYVVVDLRDQVNLVALDPASGALLWRQPLASLDWNIANDLERRFQASSPSASDGVIVCPTGAGLVVGFDPATRGLAWAHPYERRSLQHGSPTRIDEILVAERNGGWIDGTPVIAEGKVVLAPPDGDQLQCLDLRTGELSWQRDREGMWGVGCVTAGKVLLLGAQKAAALKLADGAPAWDAGARHWPDGAVPTGTGFLSNGKYFTPLSNGQVVAVDVETGEIVAATKTQRHLPLGNLVCHGGAVLSQSGRFLERFDQLEAIRAEAAAALAGGAEDVDALRTLGEIAMNEGRQSEAIDLLERAHRLAPQDVDAAAVLAECLIAALDADFASYRSKLPLLDSLADGTQDQRAALLRIRAKGLLEVGESEAAAEALLELYRLSDAGSELHAFATDWEARPVRWGRTQINAIYAACNQTQRERLVAAVAKVAPSGDESGMGSARYLEWFGDLPGAEKVRLSMARILTRQQQRLAAQQQWLSLQQSADLATRAEAVAQIAQELNAAFAESYNALLAGEYADVECGEGRLGRDLAGPRGAASLSWPQGRVEYAVKPTPTEGRMGLARLSLWGVPLESGDDVLGNASIAIETHTGRVVVRDSRGRDVFEAPVDPGAQRGGYREAGTSYAVSRGSLLVVSTGQQLAAVNTMLQPEDALQNAVLWRQQLVGRDGYDHLPGSGASGPDRPGSCRAPRAVVDGQWIGVIGPVTASGVVFHDSRRLVCVDPLTGDVQWRRGDVPAGTDLFGDEELVFVVPKLSRMAKVYSAVDGRYFGERPVPSWRERLTTRGRMAIAWQAGTKGTVLTAVDAWTHETAWAWQFAKNSRVDVDCGRFAAVIEPRGRVAVVDLATGQLVVDDDRAMPTAAEEIHLLVGGDAFTVAVSRRPTSAATKARPIAPFNQFDYPIINGEVYVYDRATGEMRWNQPAQVSQQALMLTQGVDLPALMFAGTLNRLDRSGSRALVTMLVLDKGTGRTLFRNDELRTAAAGFCQPVVGSDRHVMAIKMSSNTVELEFTNEPRPPMPPAMADVEGSSSHSQKGLSNLIKRALEAVE